MQNSQDPGPSMPAVEGLIDGGKNGWMDGILTRLHECGKNQTSLGGLEPPTSRLAAAETLGWGWDQVLDQA